MIAILIFLFFSCKKSEEMPVTPGPLEKNLEANFSFDGHYKNATGKSADGLASGTLSFTADRKGLAGHALKFDGGSKITLPGIFYKGLAATVSVWIKYESPVASLQYLLTNSGSGIAIAQSADKFGGIVSHPSTNSVYSNAVDAGWHHFVVSFDGTDIRLYVDGQLAGVKNHPGTVNDGTKDFTLGFSGSSYWKGAMDDFRVYSRLLSAEDIQQLDAL